MSYRSIYMYIINVRLIELSFLSGGYLYPELLFLVLVYVRNKQLVGEFKTDTEFDILEFYTSCAWNLKM